MFVFHVFKLTIPTVVIFSKKSRTDENCCGTLLANYACILCTSYTKASSSIPLGESTSAGRL